jgi:radical SAM protein with 4Fe4S-binding SPASM domain
VNVSFDGPGGPRGRELLLQAAAAAELLRRHRGKVGINCVVTRNSFNHLGDVCALAKRMKLSEIELLRFKPAGRAARHEVRVGSVGAAGARSAEPARSFDEFDLTPGQYAALVPTVKRLMLRHRIRIKLDCSFVPAVASAGVRPGIMEFLGASGCEGGNELCAVDAKGFVHGCSFDARRECRAEEIESRWPLEKSFRRFRRWEERGARACLDCDWFNVCRGGCHVVAKHVTGSWYAPDPSCAIAARSR